MLHQYQFICKIEVKFGIPHPYDDIIDPRDVKRDPKEYTKIFMPITQKVSFSWAVHLLRRFH